MNLRTLARLKTRDAALLYEFTFQLVGGRAGLLKQVSYESLATLLNNDGLTTSRGARFTSATIRTRLAELEELEIVEKSTPTGPTFDLFVFLPFPCTVKETEEEPTQEPGIVPDPYAGRSLFDGLDEEEKAVEKVDAVRFHFHNENDNENENGSKSGEKSESCPIVKNIINKQSLKSSKQREEIEPSEPVPVAASTATKSVDFAARPNLLRLRSKIVRDLYEYGAHSELFDRAVAAVALGYATPGDVGAAIRRAKEEQTTFDKTNGFKGERRLWRTFCPIVKGWFDAAGVVWDATSPKLEPRPVAIISVDEDDGVEKTLQQDAVIRKRVQAFRPMRKDRRLCSIQE